MIRVAVVEDEKESVTIIKNCMEKYCQKEGRQFSIDWFTNGMDFISDYEPIYDIIYMDILMPHLDGMEAAHKLRKIDKNVPLIFVTNMRQYAIKGYEVNALDFIVKPIKYYDFTMKLDKALEYVERQQDLGIVIDVGDSKIRVPLWSIYYIEVRDHILIYNTRKGKYESRGRMKVVEEELVKHNFLRCHNSYLVNPRHVMEIYPNHLVVAEDTVPISRRRKKVFMERLTEHLGGGIQYSALEDSDVP